MLAWTLTTVKHRGEFVLRHFGETVDFVSSLQPRYAPGGRREWWRWYRFGVSVALRALFDASERRYFWLGSLLLEVQAVALASPGIRKAYVFRLFDRRPYLVATYLATSYQGRDAVRVPEHPVVAKLPLLPHRHARRRHLPRERARGRLSGRARHVQDVGGAVPKPGVRRSDPGIAAARGGHRLLQFR